VKDKTVSFQRLTLSGWGRYPRIEADGANFEEIETLRACLLQCLGRDLIVHALGRSYGDSALNSTVLLTRRLDAILSFDPRSGVVTCESGTRLADLIDAFLPRGWFPAVVPGTKFITIGGAIACDVHGKNHHNAGCFSNSLVSFRLMLPDGRVVICSPQENRELFLATCGGMGLTGVILDATFRLQKVGSALVRQRTIRAENLHNVFERFEEYASWTYSVAWIDCLARGNDRGRALLMVGEHAENGTMRLPQPRHLSLPCDLPCFFLNKHSVRLFNDLYYSRASAIVHEQSISCESFFFPLDAIGHWYRLYGKRGFTQYQFVLPKQASFEGLSKVLSRISSSGMGSFLAVLKLFGPENDRFVSFPREGFTLALDFRIQQKLFPLLNELDRIVMDHGGRLYLAKDARMGSEMFKCGYPGWESFARVRRDFGLGERFNSLQSRRLEI
jgi:decaprenylphospho-beta-D-ribofuranose 2-oxidase